MVDPATSATTSADAPAHGAGSRRPGPRGPWKALRWRRAAIATSLFAVLAAAGLAGGHALADVAGAPITEHHDGHERSVGDEWDQLPIQPANPPGPGR